MAENIFNGGQSGVVQVDTLTFGGTWEADDVCKTTITNENTDQTTITTTAGSTTTTTVRDNVLADLQASSNVDFTAVTFAASGANDITVTANTAGVPFYISVATTELGGGAADLQTYVAVNTTANEGPNDWNTLLNWSLGATPASGDTVVANQGSYDILYGLDQSGIDLAQLRIDYFGSIGQLDTGYPLRIDVSYSGATSATVLYGGGGNNCHLYGTHDNVIVVGTSSSPNALKLSGSQCDSLIIINPETKGTITVDDAYTVSACKVYNAPNAKVVFGTKSGASELLEVNSGHIETKRGYTLLDVAGGSVLVKRENTELHTTVNVRGGNVDFRGSVGSGGDIITNLNLTGGSITIGKESINTVVIQNTSVMAGRLLESPAAARITFTNDVIQYGGDVRVSSGRVVQYDTLA